MRLICSIKKQWRALEVYDSGTYSKLKVNFEGIFKVELLQFYHIFEEYVNKFIPFSD